MLDTITRATTADLDTMWQLYSDVCAQQEHDAYSPGWTLGVYPTKEDIRKHIEANDLYIGRLNEEPVAAMVVSPHEDPEYVDIPWPSSAAEDEVAVVHLLAVHPRARGKRAGTAMIREAIRLSCAHGKRAIHLDVMLGNLAASRIYLAEGFKYVGTYQVFYEDTGLADCEMYELVLPSR